jgi:hypothetical protein
MTQSQMAGYWLDDNFPGLRMKNRSARCQGIAGAPGSGGHNYAISAVGGHHCAINCGFYVDQANGHASQHDIVQGMKASVCNLSLEHGPFLNPAFPPDQIRQMRQDVVGIYLGDESQPAQVYT